MNAVWSLYERANKRCDRYVDAIGQSISYAMWARAEIEAGRPEKALAYLDRLDAALDAPFAEIRARMEQSA